MHFYELSGESYDFSKGELMAALDTLSSRHDIIEEDLPVVLVDAEEDVGFRLGLCHGAYEHLFSCSYDELEDFASSGLLDRVPKGIFRVRASIKGDVPITKREMETIIGKHISGRVDLQNAEVEVGAFAPGLRVHVGVLSTSIDRTGISQRRDQKRPFFSPISLHPKYARALVNLARVKPGERILDPFCGTGGVILEAADMGMAAVGSDLVPEMVEGTGRNLEHFGLRAELFQCDVNDLVAALGAASVDAVATDPPYGRSSTTDGKDAAKVIEWGFRAASELLKPGRHAAVVLPSLDMVELGREYMELVESYPLRIHKSLTRHFCAYRKK